MNTKNVLTLIGGILTAVGPVMLLNAPNPTLFWLGQVFTALGGSLLGARGLFEKQSSDKPDPTEPVEVVAPAGIPLKVTETAPPTQKPNPTQ